MVERALESIGWNAALAAQCTAEELDSCVPARVSVQHRKHLDLWTSRADVRVAVAEAQGLPPLVIGDWLLLDAQTLRVQRLVERFSVLKRKAAGGVNSIQLMGANAQTLFILTSCNQEFKLARLERYLAMALDTNIQPVIVLTKADLCEDFSKYQSQAKDLYANLPVISLDARSEQASELLAPWLRPGQTIAMVGSSGVGKSSLASALGAVPQLVGEVRDVDQKGRHTTTWRSLHLLPSGALLMDNPGIRELYLVDCERGIALLFADVLVFLNCRFSDCQHQSEPGCGIQQAIERGALSPRRWQSYLKLMHAHPSLDRGPKSVR